MKLAYRRFKEAAAKHGNPPFYFHAVLSHHLAGDDPAMRQRSGKHVAGDLKAADELGISGVIFHTGSAKGAGFEARLPNIIGHLKTCLKADPKKGAIDHREQCRATAGRRRARFEEIARCSTSLGDPRASVCFDTCHAFASGYDERTLRR